jgi:hypothetical protein
MRYMFSMTGSHDAAVPVRRQNPFTGELIDVYPPALTDAEMAETKRLLARYGAQAEDACQFVQLADGTTVEVIAGLEGEPGRWRVSFGEYLQLLSRDAMQFLYDLCAAGTFILDGPDVGVVTDQRLFEQHRDDGFALAHSPKELEVLVKEGLTAYKQHIAGR